MQLFKRVLLSLFPDEIITQNVNPASMFVSFISTKEFFSVINRKIVENYKLNLFDIALDSFEFKVGFGDKPTMKPKDMDMYYGYCSTANINGYRFMNPANLANSLAIVSSTFSKELFEEYEPDYYINFLYTIYLLSFIFLGRMKVFPKATESANFNRFVDVFFNFYKFVFKQTAKKLDKDVFEKLKRELIGQVDLFFAFFRFYKKLNELFDYGDVSPQDISGWLFYDELGKKNYRSILEDYNKHANKYASSIRISLTEQKLYSLLLPADVLLRYLFVDADVFEVVEHIVSKIFDKEKLNKLMKSLRQEPEKLEEFLLYISDYRHYKKKFFSGVQKYVVTVFREEGHDPVAQKEFEEFDELMSSIGDDLEKLETFQVPERIKQESKLMEKILNFYVTFLGGFWVARGDSFYLRMFKKPLLDTIMSKVAIYDDRPETLNYYGSLLYQYGKNIFYYKYASDNVRAGKQKFFVPYKSTYKKVYSNMCVLKLLDENFLVTLLQDLNPKDIMLYVKNKKILDIFKDKFAGKISLLLKKDKSDLLDFFYGDLNFFFKDLDGFSDILSKELEAKDLFYLKENLYSLDLWLNISFYQKLKQKKIVFKSMYSDLCIAGIFSTCKETLFGFLLYFYFLNQVQSKRRKNLQLEFLMNLYVHDILQVSSEFEHQVKLAVLELYSEFEDVLEQWSSLDDNEKFMRISLDNWLGFIDKKSEEEMLDAINGEDLTWYRGLLKNITYYNKRYLIPK